MYKIIGHDRQVYGPVSAEQLRQWINEGRVVASTRAQCDETTDWQPLSNIPEFADAFQGAITSPEAAPVPPVEPVPVDPDALVREILARDYEVNIGSCIRRGWRLVRENFWLLSGAWLVVWLIDYVTKILGGPLEGGLNWVNLKRLRGPPARLSDVFDGFTIAFLSLFLGALVMGVLVVLGLCLLIIPGIYLLISWKFALTLMIDKKLKFWPAMRVSRQVVGHHWWRIFGLSLVLFLVAISGFMLLGIGILLTVPIARAANMFAYEDIFNVPVSKNGSGSDKDMSEPALPPRKKMSAARKGLLVAGAVAVILMILHGLKSTKSTSVPSGKAPAPVTAVKPMPPPAKAVEILASPDKVVKAISLEQLYEDNVRYDGNVVVAGTVRSVQTFKESRAHFMYIVIGSADDKYTMTFSCDAEKPLFALFNTLKEGQLVAVEGRPHLRPGGLPAAMEAIKVFTSGFTVATWDPSHASAPAVPDVLSLKQYLDGNLKLGGKGVKISGRMTSRDLKDVDGRICLKLDDGTGRLITAQSSSSSGQQENRKRLGAVELGRTVVVSGHFMFEGAGGLFMFDDVSAGAQENAAANKPVGKIKVILPALPEGVTSTASGFWTSQDYKWENNVQFTGDVWEIPPNDYRGIEIWVSLFQAGKARYRLKCQCDHKIKIQTSELLEVRIGKESDLKLEFEQERGKLTVFSSIDERFALAYIEENHDGKWQDLGPEITLTLAGDDAKTMAKATMTASVCGSHEYSFNIPKNVPPGSRIKASAKWNRGSLLGPVVGEGIYTVK